MCYLRSLIKGRDVCHSIKLLKEQFGQPSIIARSIVNKLTKGDRIQKNNRRSPSTS